MRTVGVEEELLIVDAASGTPVSLASAVLDRARAFVGGSAPGGQVSAYGVDDERRDEPGGTFEAELQQQQVEIDTRPHADLADLRDELLTLRRRADEAAGAHGARVAALATSPLPVTPLITPKRRYLRMAEEFGLTEAEQLTCGCHVHVSVCSPDEGIAVLDRLRVWLPALTAISCNSPFWQGQDSGYASYRSQAWARWPSAGPIDVQGSPEAYRQLVDGLLATGVLMDEGMVYFDARLSARYPTVEVRVADVCLDVGDTVLVAALTRALVDTSARQWREGRPMPDVPTAVLRMAQWRASRSGLDGDLLDPSDHRPRPAAEVVHALVEHVREALEEAGDARLTDTGVADLMARGTGARRQRQVLAREGDLAQVVLDAAEATSG